MDVYRLEAWEERVRERERDIEIFKSPAGDAKSLFIE